tara:strand:- start:172 stop:648 length:477 start_codon:yes stop_codon:yes gene_type:complete
MNAEIMNVIKNEDNRTDHEWKVYSLKEAKQLLADAISYQKYWNEINYEDTWENAIEYQKSREKYTVTVGFNVFCSGTMEVSVTQAKKLLTEMWEKAEEHLESDHLTGGHVYAKVSVGRYCNRFHVSYKDQVHAHQDIFDQCDALKEKLFAEKKKGEEE